MHLTMAPMTCGSSTLVVSRSLRSPSWHLSQAVSPFNDSAHERTESFSLIWSVADLLRGNYRQSDYGKVILPFTVLRRLDCVLAPTKAAGLAELATRKKAGLNPEPFLLKKSGAHFYTPGKGT